MIYTMQYAPVPLMALSPIKYLITFRKRLPLARGPFKVRRLI